MTRALEALPEACPDEDALATFASGAASREDRALVEAHVDVCSACQELLAELARTFADVGSTSPGSLGVVDRYQLLRVVGEGGMGIVYEARDPMLGRRVALKLIAGAGGDADRVLREGRAMARVDHVNVVTVFDAGVFEDRVFIAMQLVRGESLRQHLAVARPVAETIGLLRQAALGLAAAHEANVVHRDFKPENVLVGRDAVRVTDFGLARPSTKDERDVFESSPRSMDIRWSEEGKTQGLDGTPAYLSPEQIDGRAVGPQSDQFSFGVALYEALHRQHPFALGGLGGPTTLRELRARMDRGPATPIPHGDAPLWIGPVVERMLAVSPDERFATMAEVATRLAGPDERVMRLLRRLQSVLFGTMVLHVAFVMLLVGALWFPEPSDVPDWGPAVDAFLYYVFLVWGVLGFFAAPLAALGLARRTRWAYLFVLGYATVSLPTLLGTPVALTAFSVLLDVDVRAAFGRVRRRTSARSRATG
jgi:serine/threonine-protein kinase